MRDAGAVERLTDHEERGDEDHHAVAEAGDRLGCVDLAAQNERECRNDGHHVEPEPVGDEDGDGEREDGEDVEGIGAQGCLPSLRLVVRSDA